MEVEGVLSWTWLLLQAAGGDDDCMSSSRCGLQSIYKCHVKIIGNLSKLPGNLNPAKAWRVWCVVMSVTSFHPCSRGNATKLFDENGACEFSWGSRFLSPFGDESNLSAWSGLHWGPTGNEPQGMDRDTSQEEAVTAKRHDVASTQEARTERRIWHTMVREGLPVVATCWDRSGQTNGPARVSDVTRGSEEYSLAGPVHTVAASVWLKETWQLAWPWWAPTTVVCGWNLEDSGLLSVSETDPVPESLHWPYMLCIAIEGAVAKISVPWNLFPSTIWPCGLEEIQTPNFMSTARCRHH